MLTLTQRSPHCTLPGLHCPATRLSLLEAESAVEVGSDASEPGGSDEQPSTSPVIASNPRAMCEFMLPPLAIVNVSTTPCNHTQSTTYQCLARASFSPAAAVSARRNARQCDCPRPRASFCRARAPAPNPPAFRVSRAWWDPR